MWPTDFYSSVGASLDATAVLTVGDLGIDAVSVIGTFERAGLAFGATVVAALVVLGLFQGYGPGTVAKARRSPVISICIGLPAMLVVAGLTSTGYLLIGSSLGTAFGVPLVIAGGTLLPALTALGLVAIGRSIGARLGTDRLWMGVLIGGLLAGLASAWLVSAAVVGVFASALGVGAGVRVLLGKGSVSQPDERSVPPANKI